MKLTNSLKLCINSLVIAGLVASSALYAQAADDSTAAQDFCKPTAVKGADAKGADGTSVNGKSIAGKASAAATMNGRTYRISGVGSVSARAKGQDVVLRIGSDEFLAKPTALRFNDALIVRLSPDAKLVDVDLSQNVLTVTVDGQQKYQKTLDAPAKTADAKGADAKAALTPNALTIVDTLNTNKMLVPFEYQNPIATEPMRDPQVSKFGDTYWMTATSWSFFEQQGQNPGVKIWSSKDLKRWDFRTMAVLPNSDGWDAARFWAPEIRFINGKYWLTYNAMSIARKTTQYIGLAVADEPQGPYRKINVAAPLCAGNDAHLFQDDDGKVYLFRSGIEASQIDLENYKLVGDFFPVIAKGAKGQWDGGDGVGIEGPFVIKRDGTYYMFYSSWGRGYEVGIATAKNIRGPWTKAANNPFYGAQKIETTQRYGTQYTQAPDVPWTEVGHGSPFEGPDGKLWIASHGYKKGDKIWDAKLVIDPLRFENGVFQTQTPTWTPQGVKMPAKP